MAIDRNIAWTELHEPGTSSERLAQIAYEHSEFADAITAHPNAYPELVDWLGSSVNEPVEVAEIVPDAEAFDLADRILIAAATGAQAFDDLGLVFAVQELAIPLADRIRSLVRSDEELQLALPGMLVAVDRSDAVAFFAADRLIVVWKNGGARSLVVRYADVTAARIGIGPSELSDVLALYVQAQETLIFAIPSDDPAQAEFLAHLVRGVPLAQIRPDLVDDDGEPTTVPGGLDSPELVAARAELADSAIPGERMNALAAAHPELHVELAGHARTYPELLDWLESRPDPRTREAVAARRARDDGGTVVAPVTVVALPPAYAATSVDGPRPISGRTGWEHANSALDKVDSVANTAVNIAAVIYGIFLIVVGIAVAGIGFGAGNPAGFFGILIAVYGAYVALPLPGFKLIIW